MRSSILRLCPGRPFHRAIILLPVTFFFIGLTGCTTTNPLNQAVLDDNTEKVTALLKAKPRLALSTDPGGDTLLHWAASAGHEELAQLLLDDKASVYARNMNGDTPLHVAAINGNLDIVKLLVANGA